MPPSHYHGGGTAALKLSFRTVSVATVCLPLSAFLICVLWSLKYNFREATATHCGVPNYLPSISAAIGSYTPQRYIWRSGIALQSVRLLIPFMYKNFYDSHLGSFDFGWVILSRAVCVLHLIENLALIGLTYISSTENYGIHEKLFIAFMVSSELYMLLSTYLTGSIESISSVKMRSKKIKQRLAITNIASFALAVYFFFRHNQYCEPGMYTFFAFFEYVVVLTNMAFHMTSYFDFYDYEFLIGNPMQTKSL